MCYRLSKWEKKVLADPYYAMYAFEADQAELQRQYDAWVNTYPQTLEEAFDLRNRDCIKHNKTTDNLKYLMQDEDTILWEKELQWHHEEDTLPEWKTLSDKITQLIA